MGVLLGSTWGITITMLRAFIIVDASEAFTAVGLFIIALWGIAALASVRGSVHVSKMATSPGIAARSLQVTRKTYNSPDLGNLGIGA
jgi:hypothetical protein